VSAASVLLIIHPVRNRAGSIGVLHKKLVMCVIVIVMCVIVIVMCCEIIALCYFFIVINNKSYLFL
jgi:hypothetical protein